MLNSQPNGVSVSRDTRYQLGSIAVVISLWQLATVWGPGANAVIVPSPLETVAYTTSLVADPSFIGDVVNTLLRTGAATLLALIAGVPIGVGMGWSRTIDELLSPQLSALYPLPAIALLPLLMLFFSNGSVAIVIAAAFGGFFLIVWNSMVGVEQIQDLYVDVARDNGVTTTRTLFSEVLLPGALPMIVVGLRLCLYTALLIVISAEMLFGSNGLGYVLWISYQTYTIPDVYGTLVVVGTIGIVVTYGLDWVATAVLPWQPNRTANRGRLK